MTVIGNHRVPTLNCRSVEPCPDVDVRREYDNVGSLLDRRVASCCCPRAGLLWLRQFMGWPNLVECPYRWRMVKTGRDRARNLLTRFGHRRRAVVSAAFVRVRLRRDGLAAVRGGAGPDGGALALCVVRADRSASHGHRHPRATGAHAKGGRRPDGRSGNTLAPDRPIRVSSPSVA